jgi:putative transcriptional regulator
MGKFFEDLKEGLEEILAYKQGKITLKSEIIEVPEPPSEYTAKDIKHIREKCNYSQALFALFVNVSIKTVQAWETGVRVPNQATLRLLELIDKGIYQPKSHEKPIAKSKREGRPRGHVRKRPQTLQTA